MKLHVDDLVVVHEVLLWMKIYSMDELPAYISILPFHFYTFATSALPC